MPASRCLILLLLYFAYLNLFAQTIEEDVNQLLEARLAHATVGIMLREANTGIVLYQKNADKLLAPASSTKLFTAAAALYQLGPDYRYQTILAEKGNNLYLYFSGSPSFTSDNLKSLLEEIAIKKNKWIQGDLIIDLSRFQAPFYPGGLSYDDLGWYYSAPDSAAILDENMVKYKANSTVLGKPIQLTPIAEPLPIVNHAKAVNQEEAKSHCGLNIQILSDNRLELYGCVAAQANERIYAFAITDPEQHLLAHIKEFFQREGIKLKGKIVFGIMPADVIKIKTFYSPPLIDLIKHMLQESDNLYANSITKTLGFILTGEGTYKQGVYAIKKILQAHTHIDLKQLDLQDGMGTRYNLATAEQFVLLLSDLYKDEINRKILLQVLPQSGSSGTLKDRMNTSSLNQKVLAKTGTMHDISSLSGLLMKDNQPIIFSIIINGINVPIKQAKDLEEAVLTIAFNNNNPG